MVCMVNNDVPVNIPSYPNVLLNRSILCNCDIEAENNFLLESLAVCHDSTSDLVMYFTVNMAFCYLFWYFNTFVRCSYLTELDDRWADFTYFLAILWV